MSDEQKPIPAVIYGVKSSEDEKEAVKDQHRVIREKIKNEGGRVIIAEPFGEEKQSGFRKERGPQLEAAIRTAKEAAAEYGSAELWVWTSSRLARGDGTPGKRSVAKLVHDLLYEGVTVRSALDDEMVRPMLAGIASEVSNKYSADLSDWTRAGLQRRKDRGEPVGALPGLGYEAEQKLDEHGKGIVGRNGKAVTHRIVSPTTGPLAHEVFERIADGQTPGAVGRWLNGLGQRTVRKVLFNQRTIRKIIANDAFIGRNGYPRIVSDELARAARANLVRLDPAEIQRRKGGRRPNEPYLLRGVAFCADCGAALYRSYAYRSGERMYACRNRLEATGACHAPVIAAELLEAHVLNHLDTFVGSVENWISEQLAARNKTHAGRARKLEQEKAALSALISSRERQLAEYRRLADEGHSAAYVALEVVQKIDTEIEAQQRVIEQVAAVVAEHAQTPDVNAALDFYNELVDTIRGRVTGAANVEELNAALASVLAGMWCEVEASRHRVLVQFALRTPQAATLMNGEPLLFDRGDRYWLPPVGLDHPAVIEPPSLAADLREWEATDHPESDPVPVPETVQLTTVSAWPR